MREVSDTALPSALAGEGGSEVPEPAARPRHIAVIMDGNGRWAALRNLPRVVGHRHGAESVRRIVTESARLGIEALTLYSFSSENWKRPAGEVGALMSLCVEYLAGERQELLANGIRFRSIGRLEGLPAEVRQALEETEAATAGGTGMTLCIAINYGSRAEITEACRRIAERVQRGEIDAGEIDESTVAAHLDTAGLPDPDLLIRTGGEMRVSNYLLWQISYAEIHVTEVLWPEFGEGDLHRAIADFARRNRRFGGIEPSPSPAAAGQPLPLA